VPAETFAAGEGEAAIGRKRHCMGGKGIPSEAAQLLAGGQVPQFRRAGPAARKKTAVRRKRHGLDRVCIRYLRHNFSWRPVFRRLAVRRCRHYYEQYHACKLTPLPKSSSPLPDLIVRLLIEMLKLHRMQSETMAPPFGHGQRPLADHKQPAHTMAAHGSKPYWPDWLSRRDIVEHSSPAIARPSPTN
jgi:hypothetical protein